jgi:outer membrane protein assembly factor BamB
VTLDPDGFPLLYFGSRDNKLRIVALDRKAPRELWNLNAGNFPGIWNNDWDGNPIISNGLLFEGGENGYLFGIKLNRDFESNGLVSVAPEPLLAYQSWNEKLLRQVGDRNASIENSVALVDHRLFFANSAGRLLGLDISRIGFGETTTILDYWLGDDVDASIVIDEQGMLYVGVELERFLPRSDEIGQLIKLDPNKPEDPVVWSIPILPSVIDGRGGIWSTPAIYQDALFITTHSGILAAVDSLSGKLLSTDYLGPHAWSSPVAIDGKLLVATCSGEIRCYSIMDPSQMLFLWSVRIPTHGCIESTPAVWKGKIIVGARDGFIYAFGPD